MGSLNAARARRRAAIYVLAGWIRLAGAADAPAPDTLFDDRPLVAPWLRSLEGRLDISAASVEWHGTTLAGVRLPLRMQQGTLSVTGGSARIGDSGAIDIDANHAPDGSGNLRVTATRLDAGAIGAWHNYVQYAPLDLRIELRGRGTSLHRFVAGATGTVRARNNGRGRVHRAVEFAGANLVFNMLRSLDPNADSDAQTTLECFAANMPIVAGSMREDAAFELRTPRMHARGGGRIDFAAETLALQFTPRSRAPIELKSLQSVRTVSVRGSFAAPEVTVDTGHLLGRAASLGRDVARLGGGAVLGALLGQHERSLCDSPL